MNARSSTTRNGREVARAVLNLAWTATLVVGSPLVLARVFGYPLPRQMPDWGDVASTPMQLVEPKVVINVLVCIGWISWGIVIAYVLVDVVDIARGVGHRARRLGPASVVAGKLVASIALLVSLLRPQPSAAPSSRPVVVTQVVDTPPMSETPPLKITLATSTHLSLPAVAPSARVASPTTRNYVVQRGDSLWRIATEQLGDGFRWREIYDLNQAIIANPDLICTGWQLTIPADPNADLPSANTESASPEAPAVEEPAPAATPDTVLVPADPSTSATTPASSDATPEPTAPVESSVETTSIPTAVTQQSEVPHAHAAPESAPGTEAPLATGTSLPLALRAQGFETQQQYQDWLAEQRGDGPVRSDPVEDAPSSLPTSVRLGAMAIPALLAASVVAAVERRRRRVLQHRPIHAGLPRRRPELRPIEMAYRSQALVDPGEQIEWVDTILRLLTVEMDTHPEAARLLLVRPGDFGVELLWDRRPTAACPAGFREVGGDHTWEYRLDDQAGLETLRDRVTGQQPYIQALVTLGETAEGPVLVNLEAIDELDVLGEPEQVDAWVAAVALDLDAHRWAERVARSISLPSSGSPRLTTTLRITDDGRTSPLVWQATQTESSAAWSLTILPTQAVLLNDELGFSMEVAPALVSRELFSLTEELLADAVEDPYHDEDGAHLLEVPPGEPDSDDRGGGTHDVAARSFRGSSPGSRATDGMSPSEQPTSTATLLLPRAEREPIATDWDAADGVIVRVLGPVRTSGWQSRPKASRTEALVVFLAISRPTPASTDRIIDALWNGKAVTPKSVYNAITNLRRDAGDPSIVTSSADGYALDDRVMTDWDRFRLLVARARVEDWPDRRESLAVALSMVEGKPFDGAERDYPWAATDGTISRLEVAITDAAGQLATEAIEQGDCAMAVWAARRALLACPWLVRMYGYILEAHAIQGDVTAIEHTWRELQRSLGDDEMPSELVDLYETARV